MKKITLCALLLGMSGNILHADTEQFHARLAAKEAEIQALSDAVIKQEERVLAAQERIRELKRFIIEIRKASLPKASNELVAATLDKKINHFLREFFENTAADTEYFLTDSFFDDVPGEYGYLYTLLKFHTASLHCEINILLRKILAWEDAIKALA